MILTASLTAGEMSSQDSAAIKPAREVTRMYLGVDGVMVPTITDAEKAKRREQVLKRWQQCALMEPQKVAALAPLEPPRRHRKTCPVFPTN